MASDLLEIYEDFIMFRGDDRSVPVNVRYSDGTAVDLTGGGARLLVKLNKTDADGAAKIDKKIDTTLRAAGHIDDPIPTLATDPQMFFLIDPGDTSVLLLPSDGTTYHYWVQILQASGDYTTVLWGKWILEREGVTQGWTVP
jgi:hypothetical protein